MENSFVGRVMNEIGGGTSTVMQALDDTSKALVSPFVGAGALASGTETPPDAFERTRKYRERDHRGAGQK